MAKLTPMQAIKAKCLDCCCGQRQEVKECTAVDCPLHDKRGGRNPNRPKREATEAQLAALAKARTKQKADTPRLLV